ncbi:MauE/DoxX family redox-associated membrane protein [Catenulispora yoronensis]
MVGAEAVTLVLLLVPAAAAPGCACAFVLLAAFALGVGRSLRRGEDVRCLCFGVDNGPMDSSTVVRNTALAACAAAGFAGTALASGPASGAGTVVALVGGAALGALVTRWDDLHYLLFSA